MKREIQIFNNWKLVDKASERKSYIKVHSNKQMWYQNDCMDLIKRLVKLNKNYSLQLNNFKKVLFLCIFT